MIAIFRAGLYLNTIGIRDAIIPKIVKNESKERQRVNKKIPGAKADNVFRVKDKMMILNISDLSGKRLDRTRARGIPATRTNTGIRFIYINSVPVAPK